MTAYSLLRGKLVPRSEMLDSLKSDGKTSDLEVIKVFDIQSTAGSETLDYEKLQKKELVAILDERKLSYEKRDNKDDLILILLADDDLAV